MKKRILSMLLALTMIASMLPAAALAAEIPDGMNIADITAVTEIKESDEVTFTLWGSEKTAPGYTAVVPAGTETVTVTFQAGTHPTPYTDSGTGVLKLSGCWATWNEDNQAYAGGGVNHDTVQNTSGQYSIELDVAAMVEGNKLYCAYDSGYSVLYCLGFEYAAAAASEHPFLSIAVDGVKLSEDNIVSKGGFDLGDYGTDDYYDYIHLDVPYYYITVPCGTESVDVTYSAETNILASGSDAYGYATVIDASVDLVSSATVQGRTFKGGYTKNADGTQTVTTPVTAYVVDEDGNGKAITLEENGGTYEAICLFSFKYDGVNHVFEEGVCVSCGAEDPDYAPPAAEIPEGAPFTAISTDVGAAIAVEEKAAVSFGSYSDVSYYHVSIPSGATEVYVTYLAEQEFYLYDGVTYAYKVSVPEWGMGYAPGSFAVTVNEDGTKIATIPVENYLLTDGAGYGVALEDPNWNPVNLFTFEYAASGNEEHTHDYGKGEVTTQPGCESEGVRTFTCACGDSYTEKVDAVGHDWNAGEVTTQPTCEGTGVKTFTCQTDGCGKTKTESVNSVGHSWNAGEVTTPPTCEGTGVKTFTCQTDGCGKTKTESVDALGHAFGEDKKCTRDGCDEIDTSPDQVDGVYQIGTAEELLWFAEAVNGGSTAISGLLTADIDLTGVQWPGIGSNRNRFAGVFDGGGKTVTFKDASHGLFSYAFGTSSNPAVIKNVTTAGTVNSVAAVVEIARSSAYGKNAYVRIQKCVNLANVTGTTYAAGIVADARGDVKIEECANLGQISGNTADRVAPGVSGIAGYMQGYPNTCSLLNCYNLGKIVNGSGKELTGGLIGNMYNAVSITNSYNAGEAGYGIAGRVFNKTDSITNSYYLATKSSEAVPADAANYENVKPVAKTLTDLVSTDFAALLGAAFRQSCPGPVFTWQTRADHTGMEDGVCDVCELGKKQTFGVTLSTGEGYTLTGEANVLEGEDYTFTLTLTEGYQKGEAFAVKVNGEPVSETDGSYVVEAVEGPLSVTVSGVEKIPDSYAVALPGEGFGYRVTGETSVDRGGDYTFTVSFVDGFRAGEDFTVLVNGQEVTAQDGVYTVENVMKALTVTVAGVEQIPIDGTTDVTFTITQGEKKFYTSQSTNAPVAMETLEVPYFDIALYGLEKYYYNPYCYVDENGNPAARQTAGNVESAYGVVTVLHAYIYATEVYHLGYEPSEAGKGLSYLEGTFDEAVFWVGNAGSSFMNLWGYGTNLNYYVDYMYPLGRPKWGSTSDQIPLKDGDVISVHLIEDGKVSGSNFAFFTVNDEDLAFDFSQDQVDTANVTQGDELTLTMYVAGPNGEYITGYTRMADQQLYWVEDANFTANIMEVIDEEAEEPEYFWKTAGFAGLEEEDFVTDENGCISIDTLKLEPGTYYIATCGGITEGGMVDADGFKSRGNETGPALLKLVVEAHEHDMTETVAKEPTCTEDGSNAYYTCGICKTVFKDADGTVETTVEDEIIPGGHDLTEVPAKEPTYTGEGNRAYWVCEGCGLLFADEEGTEETTLEEVTLPKRNKRPSGTPSSPSMSDKTEAVIEMIEDIGKVTLEDQQAIESAREAYDALSTAQKSLVTNYDDLLDAEAALEDLLEEAAMPFVDVSKDDWFREAVRYVFDRGLMTGTTHTTFAPAATATRGMIVTVLYRMNGASYAGESGFADVSADAWYADAVAWAAEKGIVTGYGDGTFGAGDNITREQLAVILYRYAQYMGMDTVTTDENLTGFSDAGAVSAYAVQAMNWAVGEGIITGVTGTRLAPQATASRAEIATMLMRFLTN